MAQTAIVKAGEQRVDYRTEHGLVTLAPSIVRDLILSTATDEEAIVFMMMCQAYQINPFLGDQIHLVKYGQGENAKARIQLGAELFRMRGQQHPRYKSHSSGIIWYDSEQTERRTNGTFLPRGGELAGASDL